MALMYRRGVNSVILVFGCFDNSVREKDWRCRECETAAGMTRARLRQFFERMHTLCSRMFDKINTPHWS